MSDQYYTTNTGGYIPAGLPGGFFIYEADGDEKVLFAETNVVRLYGCETFEEFCEFVGGSFKGMVHPDDLHKIENQIQAQTIFSEKRHDYVRYRIITKSGETKYIEDFGHLLHWKNGKSFYYVFIVDVDRNEFFNRNRNSFAEAEILSANHDTDPLTGLFNMSFFYHKIQTLLNSPQGRRQDFTFVHIDIANFKLYNERHGFKLGDELLCELAKVIREVFAGATSARFSDDHFFVCDTDDRETANDLWPVALRQVEAALQYVNDEGLFERDRCPLWLFFDWRDGLDVATPMQGATIFALQQTLELARMLGREKEVADYPRLIKRMTAAARKYCYDAKRGVALSGPDRQLSILGQTWLIKAGVLSKKEGARALRTALSTEGCVMPGTPYGTHYLIDAMLLCDMQQEARDYLIEYWGGMVRKGADTYWEAYDPKDDFICPYGYHPVNSSCHAWGCTPVYFIHKYPEVFQK